jgi:predicted metalloprotease
MTVRRGPAIGIGGFLILLVLSILFKQDLFQLVSPGADVGQPVGVPAGIPPEASAPEEERLVQFMSFVLDDAQDTWNRIFTAEGESYQRAQLVLFSEAVQSGCGFAQSAMGPFYCPLDRKVYLDLWFFRDLHARFGAPGDFAQAYVLSHEIGHHVQNLLGIAEQVQVLQQNNPGAANELSVLMELQADCLAGVWGHSTQQRQLLDVGDLEEGLAAAAAVGDDRIQRQTAGSVTPESWTHGSSEQRVSWFRRGLEVGRVDQCDTFAALRR